MPSNRFIAREDDVLDLETGIRYSTADDAEAVADLLNSTPPQPVSGDVVAAVKALLAEWNSEDFELAGLKICMDNLAATLDSHTDSAIKEERERVLAEISPAAEFAIDLCESLASDDRISHININYFTDADKAANRLRKALAATNQSGEPEADRG